MQIQMEEEKMIEVDYRIIIRIDYLQIIDLDADDMEIYMIVYG